MSAFATLKTNKDFRTLYYRGKSVIHPAVVTYVRKNRLGTPRVGITVGKKIGNAVKRNRCRRVIREAYRQIAGNVQGGWDIVLVARTRLLRMKSTELEPILQAHLKQCGVLK